VTELAVSLNPNNVSPGLLGFIIVCILGVCVWLLCRNMGKHLNKLENEYQAEQAEAEEVEAELQGVPEQSGPAKV
jgi:type VI protein secretion system component VasK